MKRCRSAYERHNASEKVRRQEEREIIIKACFNARLFDTVIYEKDKYKVICKNKSFA